MTNSGEDSGQPSRFAFLMAAIASAVGLGNFWRFPYVAAENGGGAFVVIYLIAAVVIAIPLLIAEYAMGRKSGRSAIEGVQSLARAESQTRSWGIVAWVGTLTAFFILSFYVVVSTWIMAFIGAAATGALGGESAAASAAQLANTIGQGEGANAAKWRILGLLALYLGVLVFVVGRGMKRWLDQAAVFAMPAFMLMLIILLAFALRRGDAGQAMAFLFAPDWRGVGFKTVLAAVSQCLFSVGIGIGLMMTYGAFIDRRTHLPAASVSVVGIDTAVSLLAALALFPFVFAAGISTAVGPNLFFETIPVAFAAMPGGAIFAVLFLSLALFAAFNSSVALLEVSVAWLEERPGVTRKGAALGLGVIIFMFGAAYVFSPEYFDFVDFIIEDLLLPLGALLVAVFAGWVLSREMLTSEIGEGVVMSAWRFAIRWFVPLALSVILVLGFCDRIQDRWGVPMPALLTPFIGANI
jgi:neurotransmitter:Na+ symporter, NSS family